MTKGQVRPHFCCLTVLKQKLPGEMEKDVKGDTKAFIFPLCGIWRSQARKDKHRMGTGRKEAPWVSPAPTGVMADRNGHEWKK